MKSIFSFILFSILLFSCKAQKESSTIEKVIENLNFLDSTQAAKQILSESMDGFFEALSVVEISIQLKSELKYDDKAAALNAYKNMLQGEVYNFSSPEKEFLKSVFSQAKLIIDKLNPDLWPENIDLIKTRTNHYGPDVYYTREDAIIIPDNVFKDARTADGLLPVMLHEIYHILSRYNPEFRKNTYKLIDFLPHNRKLSLTPMLEKRRLTNPDGVTLDYAISLRDSKGKEQLAIPFLTSSQPYFSKNIPSFFGYINFDLYPIGIQKDNKAIILSDLKGKTPLSPEMQNDYFTHIKDNTQYVIHPDEVMADNFVLALTTHDDGSYKKLSQGGQKLIENLIQVLKGIKK